MPSRSRRYGRFRSFGQPCNWPCKMGRGWPTAGNPGVGPRYGPLPTDRYRTPRRDAWKLLARVGNNWSKREKNSEVIAGRTPRGPSSINRFGMRRISLPGWTSLCRKPARRAATSLALAACPVCSHADSEFEPREHDCFAARCRSKGCEAQWELRHDPEIARRDPGTDRVAERRIPVFLPGDANPDEWPDDAAPQWVDDVLGCDVLAVPVARDDGSIEFLPPRTAPRSP